MMLTTPYFLKTIFRAFSNLIKLYRPDRNYIYKVESIDECSNRIVLSCKGKGATLITSISDIGFDDYIINYLPPHHACWTGFYFGKKWCQEKKERSNTRKCNALHPNHHNSNYKIMSQNRVGEIIYQNSKNGITYTMEPVALAKNKIIAEFNPSQAFYIGFLAALKSEKTSNKKPKQQNKIVPHLRIVN